MDRRKKILYIRLIKGYGGAERRLTRIYNGLDNSESWRLVLYACCSSKEVDEFLKKEGIDTNRVVVCYTRKETASTLIKMKPEILWFFNADVVTFIVCKFLRRRNTAIVISVVGYYLSRWNSPKETLVRKIEFFLCARKAAYLDCLYPSSERSLQDHFKNVYVGVTPIPFTVQGRFFPKQKEVYGKRIIAFIARLVDYKNPILLLESSKKIKRELIENNYEVWLCGDGPLKEEVETYILNHDLSDIVKFKGYMAPEEVLPYSTIFVSLQSDENYPSQSLIEAEKCGNYCIVSEDADSHLMVGKEFSKFIRLTSGNLSNAIIDAIDICAKDGDFIIESATSFAEKTYVYENSVKYFNNVFERIVRGNSDRGEK